MLPMLRIRQQSLQTVWHHLRSLRNPDFMGEISISRDKLFKRILKFFGDFNDLTVQELVYGPLTSNRQQGEKQTKPNKNKNKSFLLCAFDDRI